MRCTQSPPLWPCQPGTSWSAKLVQQWYLHSPWKWYVPDFRLYWMIQIRISTTGSSIDESSFILCRDIAAICRCESSRKVELNESFVFEAETFEIVVLFVCSNTYLSRIVSKVRESPSLKIQLTDVVFRNDRIRWGFVIGHSVQMALTILISFIACCRFLIDVYSNTGFEKLTFKHLSRDLIMLGTILAFSCFYSFLHLWHNITAELLCFADRRYYQAWWESISLKEFYRKWNTLVQDWLFAYVYVPFKNFFNNTTIARFALIFVSGVVHEYIIVMSVGFIFPIQFLSFAIFGRK